MISSYVPLKTDVLVPTPSNRGAKEFEEDVIRFGKSNRYPVHIVRNGVMASMFKGKTTVMRSLPDFEGCLMLSDGPGMPNQVIPFVCDAKVCRTGSMDNFTRKGDSSYNQLRYMMRKASVGEVCGFLIYYPERALKTRTDAPGTFWFPVHPSHTFWRDVKAGQVTVIPRHVAQKFGILVPWVSRGGTAEPVPDVAYAVGLASRVWFNLQDPEVLRKGWKVDKEEDGEDGDE